MSQMSLFSAAAREPRAADLDGLLAGSGQVVRRGDTARVSVVVAESWRARAIAAELGRLDLDAEIVEIRGDDSTGGGGLTVRTPWTAALRPMADAWTRGAIKMPPAGWELDGPRLRWWCLAAGAAGDGGDAPRSTPSYTLLLGRGDEPAWPPIGAALAAAGVPGLLVGPRADGPAYRVVGQRRVRRLRELVGDPPDGVPAPAWPDTGYARGA